jgi:hypothetical protein
MAIKAQTLPPTRKPAVTWQGVTSAPRPRDAKPAEPDPNQLDLFRNSPTNIAGRISNNKRE